MIERGSAPAWSPDGRRLAYLAVGVFVANADGTASWEIAPIADSASGLRWSPDGQRIAWREAAAIKSVDHGWVEPGIDDDPDQPVRPLGPGFCWPCLVERRTSFIFGGCGRPGSALANLNLWSVRTDGTGLRRLTRSLAPDWAPALR